MLVKDTSAQDFFLTTTLGMTDIFTEKRLSEVNIFLEKNILCTDQQWKKMQYFIQTNSVIKGLQEIQTRARE